MILHINRKPNGSLNTLMNILNHQNYNYNVDLNLAINLTTIINMNSINQVSAPTSEAKTSQHSRKKINFKCNYYKLKISIKHKEGWDHLVI